MSDAIIKYGICADNNDPWGVGRIRVIVDDNIVPPIRTALNVQEYIAKLDALNVTNNKEHAYIPWSLGSGGRSPDPYVIEPFLPKHVNLIPKIGESVKIIHFSVGDEVGQREYIAPQTSNYDKLNFDTIETARGFSKRSTYQPKQNNLRDNGLVPDPTDVAILSRSNSDIVLPEGEVIVRAGHQNFPERIKVSRSALIQASHYQQKKVVKTAIVETNESPTKQINYLAEIYTTIYDSAVDPYYIVTDVLIYPAENVDTKNYNKYKDYFADIDNPEFLVRVKSDKSDNIISFIKNLFKNLDRNNMPLSISPDDWISKPNLAYSTLDNRTSENTEVAFYALNLYQVRYSPRNDTSVAEVLAVMDGINAELRPLSKQPTRVITQKEQEITENDPSYDENVIITGADKLFLLSWNNLKSLQNRIGKYGFSQEEVYLTLQKNTEAAVKGDSLVSLLLDLIDLIANHGHSTGVDPIGSLNKDAVTKIANIKERYLLNSPVKKDLTGGSTILNQYIRLD